MEKCDVPEKKDRESTLYNDLLFSISESAFRMGISDSTLRKYERQGVIAPMRRKDSKYRYFDSFEYARVASCMEYKQYGMSISEAVELMNMSEVERIVEKLHSQQLKMEAQQKWTGDVLNALVQLQKDIFDCKYNAEQCRIEAAPSWIYVSPDWYKDEKQDETLKQVIYCISRLMPISRVCSRGVWKDGKITMVDAGKVISEDMSQKWNFDPMGKERRIGADYCVTASMALKFDDLAALNEKILQTLHDMQSFAQEKGFCRVSSDVYMITILKTGEREHFITYRKVYMFLKRQK